MELPYVIIILNVWNLARGHIPVKRPAFKSLPANIKILENETVFLPCVVENLGDSFIKWWKDEKLLFESGKRAPFVSVRIIIMKDGLTISAIEPEESGEYHCEIVRPRPWSPLRLTHKIQVLSPPTIYPTPSDGYLVAVLGDKVRMECSVLGMPPPVVSWKTRGLITTPTEESQEVLEFTATTHLMSGIYQCEASNGIGDPVHANIFLRVLHKPEVTVEKSWIHSGPGIKTTLICHVLADPEANIEWTFNEERFRLMPPRVSSYSRGNSHIIEFNPVITSDFGNYTCTAVNRFGRSQAFIELSGVANPVAVKKIEEKSPGKFRIIWEVDSISPIFDYKMFFRKAGESEWMKLIIPADGSSSGPLHSKSYTFVGLDKFTEYEAKILARNQFGWNNSSEIFKFGFLKSIYTEEEENINKVITASKSINSGVKLSTDIIVLGFVLWTFKFSLNICDIF